MFKFVEGKESAAAYEAFVSSHPKGHFLQSLYWGEFKGNYHAIMSLDGDGKVRGAMLVTLIDAPIGKSKLLYAPRGPVCDAGDVQAMQDLIDGAKALAEKVGGYMLTMDPDVGAGEFSENLQKCGMHISGSSDNAILQPLSVFRIKVGGMSDDELMMSFHSKARYSVRSSLKSGAVCRIAGRDKLEDFQRLLTETAKRDHFTPRPMSYFNKMFDTLPENMCKLFVVELDGQVIAGSVLICYGNKTWHLYGGSDDIHTKELPNFLMQWEMMRWTIAQGCDIYDMRGVAGEGDKTKPLEGLFRFKKRFGGELEEYVGRMDLVYKPGVKNVIDLGRKVKKLIRR